ncbi:MAG: oxidoreductase [Bacteroidales bacterium]|nr:oxidoreductase [Bacteroidales bacterium]MCF8405435.1 oxidoreductase [Bacteroidales bacterium]
MEKKIKTAIVGYGLSGKAFHAPFLHVHPGFELLKVVERRQELSKRKYPYVDVVKDPEDVFHDPEVELVVICTPNIFHFEQVKKCLLEGKDVVIEKPFMPTSAECDEIIKLAESNQRKVFVYQNRRWDGDYLTIQKILASGVLGPIQYYEAHFDRFAPERKRAAWRDEANPGSGILYDLGPHLIDQALCLFGVPKTLKVKIEAQRPDSKVDDFFKLKLTYDEMEVVLTAGMLVEDFDLRYIIHGQNGSFVKYGIDPQEALLRNDVLPQSRDWGKEDKSKYGMITIDDESDGYDGLIETLPGNYMAFYDNVYDVLVKEVVVAVNPYEARNVIRIIELAFESAKSGHEININNLLYF